MSKSSKIRLYVDAPLGTGQCVGLTAAQAHYLVSVMRLAEGAGVSVFNGRDGEWQAELIEARRNRAMLRCLACSAPLALPPDVWLLFAPLKKTRTDFVVEKAAELGVRRIQPVSTDFTNAERLRRDRLQAHAVEAAEQCGATFVPEVGELVALRTLLEGWAPSRRVLWCDEGLAGFGGSQATPGADGGPAAGTGGPWAVLIGPEGGFSAAERDRLAAAPFVHPVRLGPRILRADTAAVAALTLWQITHGDWAVSSAVPMSARP
ncbi:MAG: 16S rRNA (uracil(1498)-N(3))-methyltransferase [Alkalilacustris sp.]